MLSPRKIYLLLVLVLATVSGMAYIQYHQLLVLNDIQVTDQPQLKRMAVSLLEKNFNQLENQQQLVKLNQDVDQLTNVLHQKKLVNDHIEDTIEFLPLKDISAFNARGDNGTHGFLSDIRGRGRTEGPPEFFYFPSNASNGKILCFKGNHSNNGTHNLYAYAHLEALPKEARLLRGTTFISDTHFDFTNPWHSMYNLLQFVQWQLDNECKSGERILLYHWGEIRNSLGYWIRNIFQSTNLTTNVDSMSYEGKPVCFEHAVMSRIGIGGVPKSMLKHIYTEVRCKARQMCNVTGTSLNGSTRITLVVRETRGFKNVSAWEDVIKSECGKVNGCQWLKMNLTSLPFCQQVEIMSRTDILVSVHGAQLTNMIFMNLGSKIMELFPKGWLELAGHGQFIYRNLASWVGLQHEGYWRDVDALDCPNLEDATACFAFYKDQPVGMNQTYITSWLGSVISHFSSSPSNSKDSEACKC